MSTWMEEKYPRWFVYDSYTPAGRPKLEDALMTWSKVNYMYCLIAESQLDCVVKKIQQGSIPENNFIQRYLTLEYDIP